MAGKRKLNTTVIEVESEDEDLASVSSDSEEDGENEGEEDGEEELDGDEEDVANHAEEVEGDEDDDDNDVDDDEDEEEEEEEEDEVEDFSSKEAIRKLLEPFSKDQLIEIFKEATLKNPSLVSRILKDADVDTIHRNIFIHNLGGEVTSETLEAAFTPFGKIESCTAVTENTTGRCKGYGFVLFRSRAEAKLALKEPCKRIGNRVASCQLASLGPPGSGQAHGDYAGRRLFVGNVNASLSPDRLLAFFSKFGEIEAGPVGIDPETRRFHGYAIFIYKTLEGCTKALEEPIKFFEGYELHCRKAYDASNRHKNTQTASAAAAEAVPTGMQANNSAVNYSSPGAFMVHNMLPGPTTVVGQRGSGVGMPNPVGTAGVPPRSYVIRDASISGQPYAIGGAGIPTTAYAVGVVGSANRGSGMGVNSISPSVIGNYGSLAALQGLGAYQNSTSSTAMRPQPGFSSFGTSGLAPFYGR